MPLLHDLEQAWRIDPRQDGEWNAVNINGIPPSTDWGAMILKTSSPDYVFSGQAVLRYLLATPDFYTWIALQRTSGTIPVSMAILRPDDLNRLEEETKKQTRRLEARLQLIAWIRTTAFGRVG